MVLLFCFLFFFFKSIRLPFIIEIIRFLDFVLGLTLIWSSIKLNSLYFK